MLGHHLNTISRGAEERLLTRPFKPYLEVFSETSGDPIAMGANRCYMQVIHPKVDAYDAFAIDWDPKRRGYSPAHQYEALCDRFGSERVNRAIRQRILTNQFWRACVEERIRKAEAIR